MRLTAGGRCSLWLHARIGWPRTRQWTSIEHCESISSISLFHLNIPGEREFISDSADSYAALAAVHAAENAKGFDEVRFGWCRQGRSDSMSEALLGHKRQCHCARWLWPPQQQMRGIGAPCTAHAPMHLLDRCAMAAQRRPRPLCPVPRQIELDAARRADRLERDPDQDTQQARGGGCAAQPRCAAALRACPAAANVPCWQRRSAVFRVAEGAWSRLAVRAGLAGGACPPLREQHAHSLRRALSATP